MKTSTKLFNRKYSLQTRAAFEEIPLMTITRREVGNLAANSCDEYTASQWDTTPAHSKMLASIEVSRRTEERIVTRSISHEAYRRLARFAWILMFSANVSL